VAPAWTRDCAVRETLPIRWRGSPFVDVNPLEEQPQRERQFGDERRQQDERKQLRSERRVKNNREAVGVGRKCSSRD
jgi:hypothetical protein